MTTQSINEGVCIKDTYIYDKLVAYFFTLFQGRRDVYALRGSKGGYFPQCYNKWKEYCPKQNSQKGVSCQKCPYKEWKALDREVGKDHLLGYKDNCTDVIGLYPLLEDDTCKLIVLILIIIIIRIVKIMIGKMKLMQLEKYVMKMVLMH